MLSSSLYISSQLKFYIRNLEASVITLKVILPFVDTRLCFLNIISKIYPSGD